VALLAGHALALLHRSPLQRRVKLGLIITKNYRRISWVN
jgi:hypothetical protein